MDWWNDNKLVIIPILVFLWTQYWAALQYAWRDIWLDNEEGTWRKVAYSIRALAACAGPCLVAMYKQYGGAILGLLATLLRVRFGVPTAYKKIARRPN